MQSLDEINMARREYPLKIGKRLVYFAFAAFFIFVAGFFFKEAKDFVREFWLVCALLCLIFGLILVSVAIRSRLILEGNRIEFRSAMHTFTADRNEIEGLRMIEDQYGRSITICLKEDRGAFTVSESFTGNDDLREWLKGLPDLDERDAARITLQVKHSGSLGATEDQRLHAFGRAKAWAIGLSIAAGIASIPVLFVNYTPLYTASLVLLLLFTPLGILLLHRLPLLFTLFKKKTDPRADLGFVIVWPGLGMVLSYQTANDPAHFIDSFQLIYWALLALFFYSMALFRIVWKHPSRWGVLAGLLIPGAMYGVGLINAANVLPDRSVPRVYRSVVLERYTSRHSRYLSFNLRVAPWGPLAYDDVAVPKRIYDQVKVGDQICLSLHSGFLHAPWYTLIPCQEQTSAQASRTKSGLNRDRPDVSVRNARRESAPSPPWQKDLLLSQRLVRVNSSGADCRDPG